MEFDVEERSQAGRKLPRINDSVPPQANISADVAQRFGNTTSKLCSAGRGRAEPKSSRHPTARTFPRTSHAVPWGAILLGNAAA